MKAIRTRYHGATSTMDPRIVASVADEQGVIARETVPYDYDAKDPHRPAAEALVAKMGWRGELVDGGYAGDRYWVIVEGRP